MNTQLKRIHVLLGKLDLMTQKAAMVAGFTNGRTEHSSQMTDAEATDMANFLQNEYNSRSQGEAAACDRMRKNIISLAYEMGWARVGDWKKAVVDIDKFCLGEHSLYHKPMQQHSYKELVHLVTQFKQMYKKHLNAI